MSDSAGHTSGPPPERDSLAPGAGPNRYAGGEVLAAIRRAAELFANGRPFDAHECLEPHWLAARRHDPPLATLLRGWIHLAAAAHHAARGNGIGARAQTERALALLETPAARARAAEFGLAALPFPPPNAAAAGR
ncbi:MAG: DUF309 domain-containing protein [Planctomycetaceae bacterium]|nr:DUF309 domain-containing protein [Planctomycetaceae bacterium]